MAPTGGRIPASPNISETKQACNKPTAVNTNGWGLQFFFMPFSGQVKIGKIALHAKFKLKILDYTQTCAKIPKRSKIQDPLDPRSGIQVDLGSSSSGFVEGSRGSWIQHFRFSERSYGSWIQHCRFCEESYGSWTLLFNFSRDLVDFYWFYNISDLFLC